MTDEFQQLQQQQQNTAEKEELERKLKAMREGQRQSMYGLVSSQLADVEADKEIIDLIQYTVNPTHVSIVEEVRFDVTEGGAPMQVTQELGNAVLYKSTFFNGITLYLVDNPFDKV